MSGFIEFIMYEIINVHVSKTQSQNAKTCMEFITSEKAHRINVFDLFLSASEDLFFL